MLLMQLLSVMQLFRKVNKMNNFKIEDTRPFDLNSAKAGAPYAQRNGLAARIGIWDGKSEYPLFGVKSCVNEIEVESSWTNDGYFNKTDPPYEDDLVMLPLGYCEGKPVFIGDELVSYNKKSFLAFPIHRHRLFEDYTWPRTAPVMPNMNVTCFETIEKAIHYSRKEIEAYWKALDEYESAK